MDDGYITVEEAAAILRVSPRQVNRYGHGDDARLRTRRAGRRILYHQGDVLTLADDLDVSSKPAPALAPELALMPPGEVLTYIRERDQQALELTSRLSEAMRRIGQLEGSLEQRLLPEDERALRERVASLEETERTLREQLAAAEQERDRLQAEHTSRPRSWWQRFLGRG